MSDPEPAPPGQRARGWLLTRRGWTLLLIAAVLAAGGLLVRIDELFPLALAALSLVGASSLWVRLRPWTLEGRRYLPVSRVPQGSPARVDLSATNLGRRRSPVLVARDPFDGGRRFAQFAISPLEPGVTVTNSYRLPTGQRGLFSVGPMEFRCDDPFGVAARTRFSGGRSLLCVHPAFDTVPPLRLGWAGLDGAQRESTRTALHGEDFYALREYQVGDDLRRVHWASSARADRLMIREDHEPAASRLLLIGDLRSSRHNAESLERTLSVLASLADAGLRGSHSVRVTTTGGADSHWGEGSQHALSIMDLLAAANADAPKRTTSLLRCCWDHASAGATLVVVTTDGVAASDLAADVVAGGAAVVVIQRAADPGGSATQGSGSLPWPAVPVALGLPFSSAWADRPAALR